ncbi:fmt, partial [Symbiodinium microadriaticum]
ELRIVFMGTPEFAVSSLRILAENSKNIVGVITALDKPQGRGKKLGQSPVKEYAESQDLKVLQPTNLKAPEFLKELKALEADLQVVVAFRMLPEAVWDMPPLGTFNLHASLLPQYRGAAPINWAIINGEKKTGVTTFFLQHEIDTGKIIFQEEEPILQDDSVGTLYERLMKRGAKLVLKTVNAVQEGSYPQIAQEDSNNLKSAPKIFKEDCKIYWDQDSEDIRNFVRGLSPYPGAWTTMHGQVLKIYHVSQDESDLEPGTFNKSNDKIQVGTKTKSLILEDIQLQGKKRMKTIEFLRGYRVIGKDNDLPWHLPDDFKFFQQMTKGHHVIMGRKNFESLPPKFRPLPFRTNIILTRNSNYDKPGTITVENLEKALSMAKTAGDSEPFIIGGGEIYKMCIPSVDRMYITEIKTELDGDTFFPEIDWSEWVEIARESHPRDEKHTYEFDFVDLHRRILGICHLVYGTLNLIIILLVILLVQTLHPIIANEINESSSEIGLFVFSLFTQFMSYILWGIILLIALPSIIGGAALLNKAKWALGFLMVPGCLSIFSFPFGTIIGVYTILVFVQSVVWITGASGGIGEALVYNIAYKGAKLIISARRQEELERVRSNCPNPDQVYVLVLDLADSGSINDKVEEATSTFGHIDILINNGGISQRDLAVNTDIAVDRRLMEVNYFGTIAVSKALLPHQIKRKSGHHVVVTSAVGIISTPFRSSYAAAKHALHGFYDSLRAEVHKDNIKVSLVCPGFIRTNISINALTGDGTKQNTMDDAQANGMTPEECARKIVKAIQKNSEETYIGGLKEVAGIYVKRFFPGLFSKMVRKLAVT